MRRMIFLLALTASSALFAVGAHAQDRIQLFGGYSWIHASVPLQEAPICTGGCGTTTVSAHPNLSGWEFSAQYKPGAYLGFVGDFTGQYGTTHGANTHLNTYLFGPQFSLSSKISPFAHALVGVAHESVSSGIDPDNLNLIVGQSENAFAAQFGVGIDIEVLPFLSVRPIAIDYLLTRFNSGTQSQPRVSAGIVFRF